LLEFFENLDPPGDIQPATPVGKGRRCQVEPPLHLRAILQGRFPDFFPVIGIEDLQHLHDFTLAPLAGGGQSRVINLPPNQPLP